MCCIGLLFLSFVYIFFMIISTDSVDAVRFFYVFFLFYDYQHGQRLLVRRHVLEDTCDTCSYHPLFSNVLYVVSFV